MREERSKRRPENLRDEGVHQGVLERGGQEDVSRQDRQTGTEVLSGGICMIGEFDILAHIREQRAQEVNREIKKRCGECGAALRFDGSCPKCDAPDGFDWSGE